METQQLIQDVESTSAELLQLIDSFHPSLFNTVPFEGSWTPGQVAEHLDLSTTGILKAIRGNTAPTNRDPEKMVAPLREAFLNFSIKFQSPDFIIPSDAPKDKASLMRSLSEAWKGIADVARTQDLDLTCLDFEFPTVGVMTRVEQISFCVVHTKRHIWQLKKMKGIAE